MNETLYVKFSAIHRPIRHVCEIGVYKPETSNVLDFIKDGIRTTLVEADPRTVEEIKAAFGAMPNVTIHSVAVADEETQLTFYRAGSSTFASSLSTSPALENDRYRPSAAEEFVVSAKPFSSIDDGSIDILSIDIEGGEWFALKHLTSAPLVISIETHGKCYRNPFLREIRNWMKMHDYVIWYIDNSDTVYIKAGTIRQTLTGSLKLLCIQAWIAVFRWTKRFFRFFKK